MIYLFSPLSAKITILDIKRKWLRIGEDDIVLLFSVTYMPSAGQPKEDSKYYIL